MIDFQYKLPRIKVEGKRVGQYNNPELLLPGLLTTSDFRLGEFLHLLHNVVADERRLLFIDGQVISCCHNWIRDHVHMMKAFRHWDYKLKSFLQFIIEKQTKEGFYFELVKQLDDAHHTFVDSSCAQIYEEDNVALTRLELEADVEYLVVEGCWQYYRATGDFEWIKTVIDSLEKAINYMTSSPKRWDKEHGLVIRPFTIDTWDFTSGKNAGLDRRIHEDEPMSAMHGDNSGVYAAMKILAFFREKMGDSEKAKEWESRAESLKENMFRYLWNGDFFIHQFHINHKGLDDKENIRLSLSNGYDMNRGVTNLMQSRKIIEEYLRRRETTDAFAEWFSIDPPYEKFSIYPPGQYVNGGISPFTAGEVARAAFENGYEEYGWDIIKRLMEICEEEKTLSFLYAPSGKERENGTGPSGWGAASLLNAIDEGLAGVVDKDCLYKIIDFAPRFVVTHYTELRYFTGYECTERFIDIRFIINEQGMRYDVLSKAEQINAHILLPKGKTCKELYVNGEKTNFVNNRIADSNYVDVSVKGEKHLKFEILFA